MFLFDRFYIARSVVRLIKKLFFACFSAMAPKKATKSVEQLHREIVVLGENIRSNAAVSAKQDVTKPAVISPKTVKFVEPEIPAPPPVGAFPLFPYFWVNHCMKIKQIIFYVDLVRYVLMRIRIE